MFSKQLRLSLQFSFSLVPIRVSLNRPFAAIQTFSNMYLQTWLYCVFLFYSSQKYFLIFTVISFLTYCLFKNLFNIHIFVNFPDFVVLLISNLIPLWSEYILCLITGYFKLI